MMPKVKQSMRRFSNLFFGTKNGDPDSLGSSSDHHAGGLPTSGGPQIAQETLQDFEGPLFYFLQGFLGGLSITTPKGGGEVDKYFRKNGEGDTLGGQPREVFTILHWTGSCWQRNPIVCFEAVNAPTEPGMEAA